MRENLSLATCSPDPEALLNILIKFKQKRGEKRNQSISWLPVAQLLKTVLFLGFNLKQQPIVDPDVVGIIKI